MSEYISNAYNRTWHIVSATQVLAEIIIICYFSCLSPLLSHDICLQNELSSTRSDYSHCISSWGWPTNYHKLHGLKQQRGQKFKISFMGAEIMGLTGFHCLWSFLGRIHSWTLPGSGGCQHSFACGPITLISASVVTLPPPLLCVSNLPLLLYHKDTCDGIWCLLT